jgi:ParB/RepB/Spo0J family partition protein
MKPHIKTNVKKIKLKDIKLGENSRVENKGMAELMTSIKQDGLLQPVGVIPNGKGYNLVYGNRRVDAHKKLGWKTIDAVILKNGKNKDDFYLTNLTENLQRLNLSIFEEGRIYHKLSKRKKDPLTVAEIASRVGKSAGHVRSCINVFQYIPEEYSKDVKHGNTLKKKDSKGVPANSAKHIAALGKELGFTKKQRGTLLKAAKERKITARQFTVIGLELKRGKTTEEALYSAKSYDTLRPSFLIKKSDVVKIEKKSGMNIKRWLRGEILKKKSLKDVLV